jgi:hypothetical protein
MSNLSIIERLEQQLAAYSAGEVTRASFVDFLHNSILALENVPMSVRYELRTQETAIETEGYFDDEGFESNPLAAREELCAWLQSLKEKFCD